MNYKTIFIPVVGNYSRFEKEYETAEQAEAVLNAIADYTLLLHECSFMEETSNIGMVCRKDCDGDWVEIDESEPEKRKEALDELTELSQDLGLYK